jgi:hypothetical protein
MMEQEDGDYVEDVKVGKLMSEELEWETVAGILCSVGEALRWEEDAEGVPWISMMLRQMSLGWAGESVVVTCRKEE